MKLILGQRQTYKTTEAIMASHATGATILAANEMRAHNIIDMAKQINRDIPTPITIRELRRMPKGMIEKLIIDDLDAIIEDVLRRDLEAEILVAFMNAEHVIERRTADGADEAAGQPE